MDEDEKVALGFKIQILDDDYGKSVNVRWLQGTDQVLFESFCGMMKRTIDAASAPEDVQMT